MLFQKGPRLSVDVIIPDSEGRVILINRGHRPFKGDWCLPGGMVDEGETVEQAAIREVREEIGVDVHIDRMLGVFSDPDRDPRGHFVSIALVARPTNVEPRITEEARGSMLTDKTIHVPMAFDHARILDAYWAGNGSRPTVIA